MLTEQQVNSYAQSYVEQGYELAVDLFIVNSKGQILTQKRSMDRRLYPGCWDLPGGHVEQGETLLEAIIKELKEETQWDLAGVLEFLEAEEWIVPADKIRPGENGKKVILKFLINAVQDRPPVLEEGKAIEFRWIDTSNLQVLMENRNEGENAYVYRSVKKVLEKLVE